MDAGRIRTLLAPFLDGETLSGQQVDYISIYIDILLRWNARVNLTAVRDPEQIVTRHFGESLFLARYLFSAPGPNLETGQVELQAAASALRAADLGSGAGFPGLPLRLWAPALHVTLIESSQKKATFLREVIRVLELTNVDVFAGRGEALAPASFDLVTMRAVENFEAALTTAVGLVRTSGHLALLLGRTQSSKVPNLQPDFSWDEAAQIPGSDQRVIRIGVREPS